MPWGKEGSKEMLLYASRTTCFANGIVLDQDVKIILGLHKSFTDKKANEGEIAQSLHRAIRFGQAQSLQPLPPIRRSGGIGD